MPWQFVTLPFYFIAFLSSSFLFFEDGTRIAASNTIESLMEQDFDLVINDVSYRVTSPPRERISRVQNLFH